MAEINDGFGRNSPHASMSFRVRLRSQWTTTCPELARIENTRGAGEILHVGVSEGGLGGASSGGKSGSQRRNLVDH